MPFKERKRRKNSGNRNIEKGKLKLVLNRKSPLQKVSHLSPCMKNAHLCCCTLTTDMHHYITQELQTELCRLWHVRNEKFYHFQNTQKQETNKSASGIITSR